MNFHSFLISFCHFSVRLGVGQAVYCISVFVSKNGRSSSLPQKQLNWPLSTSQEHLCSSCCQLCSRQSPAGFRAGWSSPPRAEVSCVPRELRAGCAGVSLVSQGSSCSRVPSRVPPAVPGSQQGVCWPWHRGCLRALPHVWGSSSACPGCTHALATPQDV